LTFHYTVIALLVLATGHIRLRHSYAADFTLAADITPADSWWWMRPAAAFRRFRLWSFIDWYYCLLLLIYLDWFSLRRYLLFHLYLYINIECYAILLAIITIDTIIGFAIIVHSFFFHSWDCHYISIIIAIIIARHTLHLLRFDSLYHCHRHYCCLYYYY